MFKDRAPGGYGLWFAPQVFLTDSFFVRPGLGFGVSKVIVSTNTTREDVGFSGGFAAGNEWRLTKRFALSPEVKFIYLRAEGFNNFSIGIAADLRWYF